MGGLDGIWGVCQHSQLAELAECSCPCQKSRQGFGGGSLVAGHGHNYQTKLCTDLAGLKDPLPQPWKAQ